ncbi:hypothetical protein [Reyranella sp.]|uniref:hypothetical protein n=1 Tax=Reyranella sp. TaxID=1929291 RepID=UPI003D13AF10
MHWSLPAWGSPFHARALEIMQALLIKYLKRTLLVFVFVVAGVTLLAVRAWGSHAGQPFLRRQPALPR